MDAMSDQDLLRRPVELDSGCGPYVTAGGRELVCLCSNDYLGLAGDEAVKAAAINAVNLMGLGAGASRLISGTTGLHTQLERRLAEFKLTPDALVTPTGWMANHSAIHAMVGAGDLILCDKLNHASIVDASLSSGARLRTYAHSSIAHLEAMLDKHRTKFRRCLIVTDSLFSMDGDVAPLGQIVELKNRFDAQLLIDEAHATGVFGRCGRGIGELFGVEHEVDVVVGTLSKAIGGLGGFVAGPGVLIEKIRNTGRSYMYTTALPPALCAGAIQALDIIRDQPDRRARVLENARWLREELRVPCGSASAGEFAGSGTISQIIPIIIGGAAEAITLSRLLMDKGFLVPAIRPPTVPKGSSRLRVSLSASHDRVDIERFACTLRKSINP